MGTHSEQDDQEPLTLNAHINVSALYARADRAERREGRAWGDHDDDDDLGEEETVAYRKHSLPLPVRTLQGVGPANLASSAEPASSEPATTSQRRPPPPADEQLAPAPSLPSVPLPLPAPEPEASRKRRVARGSDQVVDPGVCAIAAPSSPTLFIAEPHTILPLSEPALAVEPSQDEAKPQFSSPWALFFALLSALSMAVAFGVGGTLVLPILKANLTSGYLAMGLATGGALISCALLVRICYGTLGLFAPLCGAMAAVTALWAIPPELALVVTPLAVVLAAATFLVRELALR